MDKPSEWREMLLQYRLNELDEEQREKMDARLITDEEFAEAMQDAEYDLLDAYAAQELSASDRMRVERALKPAGRFSPGTGGHIIQPVHVQSAPDAAAVRQAHTPRRRWAPLFATAAGLLVLAGLAGGLWLTYRSKPGEVAQQPQNSPSTAELQPGKGVSAPLPNVRGSKIQTPISEQQNIAELVLPGALRSQATLRLPIAQGVKSVRFVWLPDQARAAGFELQVVGDDGKPGCRSRGTLSKAHGGAVSFSCPAAAVPNGTSFVRVMALHAAPEDAPLLEVAVKVVKAPLH